MLPFGDINVIILTDVHSFVGGHSSVHEPKLNADLGHVLSFYQHIENELGAVNGNVFLVNNGDWMDGTGLTTNPPNELVEIIKHMPYSALNIGNHELYMNSTVEAIVKRPGGYADWWGGRYLTSNVILRSTGVPLGNRYTILHGGDGSTRVLAFGFLYDMSDAVSMVKVEPVEEVIVSKWFREALVNEKFDAILVLAHMHVTDELVYVLLEGIREVVGVKIPVQFVTGHSHIRAYENATDECSSSIESGRFLDTIGIASFSKDSECRFEHKFIDGNADSLREAIGVEKLYTDEGYALSNYISEAQARLGLMDVVGCSPKHYSYMYNMSKHFNSFWRLYLQEIVPSSKLFGGHQKSTKKQHHNGPSTSVKPALFQDTGAFRYDLFEGVATVNDVITLSPFNDTFYLVGTNLSGAIIENIYNELTVYENATMFGTIQSFPRYAFSPREPIDVNSTYDLYSGHFGLQGIVDKLHELHQIHVEPQKLRIGSTGIIMDYIIKNWPCSGSHHATSGGGSSSGSHHSSHHPHFPGGVEDFKSKIPDRTEGSDIGLLVLSVLYFSAVCGFLSFRRKKRQRAERMAFENTEAELEPVTVAVFA